MLAAKRALSLLGPALAPLAPLAPPVLLSFMRIGKLDDTAVARVAWFPFAYVTGSFEAFLLRSCYYDNFVGVTDV